MGKIVLAELVVVGKQPLDALLFLGGSLLDKDLRPGHRLDKLAMFGPASLCLIDFALGCHSTLLFVELLSDVQVLVAVDDLQEFWSDLGVRLGAEFKPFAECDEHFYGIHHGSLLIQLLNDA